MGSCLTQLQSELGCLDLVAFFGGTVLVWLVSVPPCWSREFSIGG